MNYISLKIKSFESGKLYEGYIRLLQEIHIDQVVNLQEATLKELPHNEIYFPISRAEIEEAFEGKGLISGVFIDERLIAFSLLTFPGISEANLGNDLGLSKEELDKVIYLKAAIVDTEFRSNSLQKKLNEYMLEKIRRYKEYKYITSTVSPYNYGSVFNTLALNLLIVKLKHKYKNYLRYIFFQDENNVIELDKKNIKAVVSDDIEEQINLIEQGYYGFSYKKEKGLVKILYGKPLIKGR